MKKISYTLLLSLIINLTIQAQNYTQIIDLYSQNEVIGKNNVYYKDTQNYLNQYVGTWLYTNGATSLKITFQKKYFTEQNTQGTYYIDALVGEYEYKVNGVTVFNTLNNLSINHNASLKFHLFERTRFPNFDNCYQCIIPNQRLVLYYDEPTNDNSSLMGLMYIHTFIENGQTKLYMSLYTDYNGMDINKYNIHLPATTTQLTLPNGNYIFNKVN